MRKAPGHFCFFIRPFSNMEGENAYLLFSVLVAEPLFLLQFPPPPPPFFKVGSKGLESSCLWLLVTTSMGRNYSFIISWCCALKCSSLSLVPWREIWPTSFQHSPTSRWICIVGFRWEIWQQLVFMCLSDSQEMSKWKCCITAFPAQ